MEIMEQLAAVAAVLTLLVAGAWWLRRRGLTTPTLPGRTRSRRLESIERLPLGPQQTLHLIRMGERALLVASYPSGCALLSSTSWREVDAPREVTP